MKKIKTSLGVLTIIAFLGFMNPVIAQNLSTTTYDTVTTITDTAKITDTPKLKVGHHHHGNWGLVGLVGLLGLLGLRKKETNVYKNQTTTTPN